MGGCVSGKVCVVFWKGCWVFGSDGESGCDVCDCGRFAVIKMHIVVGYVDVCG